MINHEFSSFLRERNYRLSHVEFDGNVHRFRSDGASRDHAYYVGFSDGAVFFGDWKTSEQRTFGGNGRNWREDKETQRKLERERERYRRERAQTMRESAATAENIYKYSRQTGLPCYFKAKGFSEAYGVRSQLGETGRVAIVPLRNITGDLISIQFIYPDGEKRYLSGGSIDCFFSVGIITEATKRIYVTEGVATALSVHMATGEPVVAAMSAERLRATCKALRGKYADCDLIVAGDNDRAGHNGASCAQKEVENCYSVFPPPGMDFDDVRQKDGIETVKEILNNTSTEDDLSRKCFVELGFDGDIYYFMTEKSSRIIPITKFSDEKFDMLAPWEYWSKNYLIKKINDKTGEESFKFAKDRARRDLIDACDRIGPFDSSKIRGCGFWREKNKYILNTGKFLLVDGKKYSYTDYVKKSNKFYYCCSKFSVNPGRETVSDSDISNLIEIFRMFKWKQSWMGDFLLGWIFVSRIAGALPVRPYIWITAASESGKSILFERVISQSLGNSRGRASVIGRTTEAGIRAKVRNDSVPIIYDEFETSDKLSSEEKKLIFNLVRVGFYPTQTGIIKGVAGGGGTNEYQFNSPMLVSSIRTNFSDEADRNRVFVLDLEPHGNDPVHWARLDGAITEHMSEDLGERIFATAVERIDTVIKNYQCFKPLIAQILGSRSGDLIGIILAGRMALESSKPISKDVAGAVLDEIDFNDHITDAFLGDSEECFTHIMTSRINFQESSIANNYIGSEPREQLIRRDDTIEEVLRFGSPDSISALSGYGISIKKNADGIKFITISNNHHQIKKIFKNTKWENNGWPTSLSRLPGAEKNKTQRYKKMVSKAVMIPFDLLKLFE